MLAIDYREVMEHLNSRIVGQDRAIGQLKQALMLAQANITSQDKPLCVLFFAGPTGVGKSETVVALAEAIHEDGSNVCRVDCNLLKREHYASSLAGSPPGYVGSGGGGGSGDKGQTLLDKETIEGKQGRPGILVFEEIEKAHPMVWDTLMGIFDKGKLTLANGQEEINFSNTFIIMTSNVGSDELKKEAEGKKFGFTDRDEEKNQRITKQEFNLDGDVRKRIVRQAQEKAFRPEWINRIDYTVVFRWLTPPELMVICDRMIDDLNSRLLGRQVFLEATTPAKELLIEKGFDLKYGARPLKSVVRKYLEIPIAEDICENHQNGRKYIARRKGDEIHFDYGEVTILEPPEKPKEEPPERAKDPETSEVEANLQMLNRQKTFNLYFYAKEREVFDRWSQVLKIPEVAYYLCTFEEDDFYQLVGILSHLENRLTQMYQFAGFKPEAADLVDFATCSILFAKGVFDSKAYWELINAHLT